MSERGAASSGLRSAATREDGAPKRLAEPGDRAESILVVDDDPTVSDVVRRYLERAGYTVTLSADGRDALAVYDRDPPHSRGAALWLPGAGGLGGGPGRAHPPARF